MRKNIILFLLCMMTVHLAVSQCYPLRHSTNFFDGWISCETAKNPNPDRGDSHFIMYDFGKVYKLGQMSIWNTNDPAHLDWGMRDVAIDYSLDGESWLTAGDFTFPQADGTSTYEGAEGPYLNDIEARYLLITGINNYGGSCFGLSEMRVAAEEVIISDVDDVLECVGVTVYPNPFAEKITMTLTPGCSGEIRYAVYDELGREVTVQKRNLNSGHHTAVEIGQDLPAGTYMLKIEFGGKSIQRSIVKVNRT